MDSRVQALIETLNRAPRCGSPEQAHALVSSSIKDLDLRGRDPHGNDFKWVIPALTSESVRSYGVGGYALRLIGHHIYLNSTGAFGIYELTDAVRNIYEKESQDGTKFIEEKNYRMPY